jgi:hypothetical protein
MDSTFNSSSHFTTRTVIIFFISLIGICALASGCSTSATTATVGVATGNQSPDIFSENIKGEMISLSGHKGSYVLVEFWDSQNSDARKNHYEMQRIYNKYKDATFDNGKKFCIYSVSLDTDREKWEAAVAEDNMQWPCNTIDQRSWNSPAVLAYSISYLPKYYLIDGNGVVIRRNIMIKDLDAILGENLQGRLSNS